MKIQGKRFGLNIEVQLKEDSSGKHYIDTAYPVERKKINPTTGLINNLDEEDLKDFYKNSSTAKLLQIFNESYTFSKNNGMESNKLNPKFIVNLKKMGEKVEVTNINGKSVKLLVPDKKKLQFDTMFQFVNGSTLELK